MEDREEGESSEQGIEKKKEGNGQKSGHKHAGQKDDEVMASMLADFVDCPPDDDDGSASRSQP